VTPPTGTTPPAINAVLDVPAAFTSTLAEAFARRPGPTFALVLSGGPTAQACYERAAALPPGTIDWSAVWVYMGDERLVAPDDPDANQRLVRAALLDRVGPVGGFVPMPTTGPIEDCVARYQAVIAQLLAGAGIDLIHLGMGPDGHTASLFSGAPTLAAGPDTFVLATTDPDGRNPHPRMTLTLSAINRARLAVFTVSGAAKHEAIAALRAGADLPAARVAAAEVRWLVDRAALEPSDETDGAIARTP
jgi:6-phosphogluconolactonase